MEDMSVTPIAGSSSSRIGAANRSCPKNLREWLALIDAAGELHRVAAPVALKEELAAVTYLAARDEKAPALLFDRFSDHDGEARILTNMLGSSVRRYAIALGLDAEAHLLDLIQSTRALMTARLPPQSIAPERAPVNEVILTGEDVDLTKLPVPQFWPGDGGPYIGTGDITLTRHPDTSRLNVGVYRQMLHGPRRVGMYCSPGKHGKIDREAWWARGEPCEVVVAYGIDPILFMVGAQSFSVEESELDVAGGIMGAPVEVTSGVATSLPIPAQAEIVIEGLLHQGDLEMEGPLGEFTGYYGGVRAPQPVIEVKALHMRKAPILTAALMANYPSCEIGAYYAIMRSARVWDDLQRLGVPGIRGVYAHPAAASGWGMLVVSVAQHYAGHVAQVLALAGQCPA
jgi:4-hydroxy-3-polyprenylbenzoate decarboxylase